MSTVEDRGSHIRQERGRLKIRRVDANRYRVSDTMDVASNTASGIICQMQQRRVRALPLQPSES